MERPNTPVAPAGIVAGPKEPLARYFMMKAGQRHGPITPRQMVDLGLTGAHAVWREGLRGWTRAADVPELTKLVGKLPPPPPVTQTPVAVSAKKAPPVTPPSRAAVYASSAMHLTGHVLGSFRKVDLRREVWPLNATAARTMAGDPTFWWVTLLAALPLLFLTLNDSDQTLFAFSLFFAGIWALIYCYVVRGEQVAWGWRIAVFLFTGVVGINGLLLVYRLLPTWYGGLTESTSLAVRSIGYVARVGVLEEATKGLPVVALALLLRRRLNHADVVLLGLFSGLGFAAFENLTYFRNQLLSNVSGAVDTVDAARTAAVTGEAAFGQLANGAFVTMLLPLVRSLANPFSHAAWGGIVAHFIGVAAGENAKGRRVALVASGLAVAAVLHGSYDTLFDVQPVLPAVVAVLSFMLLRMYLEGSTPTGAVSGPAASVESVTAGESVLLSGASHG